MTAARARPTSVAAIVCSLLGAGQSLACNSPGERDGGDARRGGSVVVRLPAAPDSLDPAVASSPQAIQALSLVYTPALTYRRAEGAGGTEVVPGLAETMPEVSDEGLTWTLTFRKGLRYSDGRPLRAADLERGLRRALRLNPAAVEQLGAVVGATDYARADVAGRDIPGVVSNAATRRVRIRLQTPDPGLKYALAAIWAAPVPPGVPMSDASRRPPSGVGSYVLAGRRRGTAFVLSRRRDFELPGVPAGHVDEIAGRVVPDAADAVGAVIEGGLDEFDGEPPAALLPEIRSKYKDRYEETATLRTRFVEMDVDRRPFRDRDVRRALAYALDERALGRLYDGFMDPACTVLPPQVPGFRRPDPCPFGGREGNPDLERASKLVERSPESGARVLVSGGSDPARAPALARFLTQAMSKIGLRARVARTRNERRRAQVRIGERHPSVPHPAGYLESVRAPLVQAQAQALTGEGDPRELAGEWADLDDDVVRDAALAPFGVATTGSLLSERLDAENCLRVHPVFGVDWSSLCLR